MIIKNTVRQRGKVWGAVQLVRLIGSTLRVEAIGFDAVQLMKGEGQQVVYAFFHGNLFPLVYAHRNQGVCILSSLSRDGEFLSGILMSMGFHVVRGSSSRGGLRGLLEMTRAVSQGADGGIAVDGPRGPKFQVKPGILLVGEKSQAPIIPIGVGFSRAKRFMKSWDEFLLPYPFSRVVLAYGEPLPMEGGPSTKQKALQERLFQLHERAQRQAMRL